jgi:hypothetical protein
VQAADGLGEDCPTADAAATVVASAVQTGGAAMTTAGSSTPSSDMTITEHELEQCQRGPDCRPLRDHHPRAEPQAGDHRPLHWRAADPDPGRAGLAAVSVAIDPAPFRGTAAADLGPQVQLTGAAQSGQPQSGGAADLRPVPLQLRQRRQRGEAKQLYEDFAVPTPGKRCSRRLGPT